MSLGRRRRPPTPPFVANELWRRAGEVPSFHIAPARTRNATDLITGNLLGTYNSASPAWAVGPDGVLALPAANAPVIEYDPVTLQCLGARIWGPVTNLLLRSEELGNAAWSRAALTVSSDVTTSPKGAQDADKLVESATNAEHGTWQSRSAQSETMTLSIFAKASERSRIRIGFSNFSTAACGAIFNLNTGAVISTDAANPDYTSPTASIFAYPAGWYRCVFTVTKGTVNNTNNPFVNIVNNSNQFIYAGDGTSGLFAVGAQVNTGPLAPYVPTTTTTASSTADAWDITSLTAGINNIRTVYARVRTAASANHGIIALDDTTSSNRLKLLSSGTDAKVTAVTSGSTVADLIGGTIVANKTFNVAARFDGNNYAISVNGAPVVTDNDGARAIVGRIMLGRGLQAGEYLNGYIEEMAGWTRACTDAQVAALAAS